MKTQTHRVQTRYARRHAARAIAERCGSAVGCILDARRDPTDHHAPQPLTPSSTLKRT